MISLLFTFIILAVFVKAGLFTTISPDFQLLCVCVLLAGGIAGMRGGKHD